MISIPLDLPVILAFIVAFLYVGTRMGAREHQGWLFSKEMFMVLLVVVVLFCIGLDGQGIWHLLTTMGH
jgi:hypothetical protein